MAKKTVGSLNVLLTLGTGQFTRGIAAATGQIQRFAVLTAKVGAGVAGSLIAAGTAAAYLTKQAGDNADRLVKMSDSLGIASERMAGFQLAADLAGASIEGIERGMMQFQKALSEAKTGSKAAREAFAFLNLDPTALATKKPDAALLEVFDALNRIGNQADRTRAAMDLFGKSSRDVLKIVNSQTKSVGEAVAVTQKFGTALNRIDANKIEQMNDSLRVTREIFNGIWTQLALKVAPAITAAANQFTAWADKTHLVQRAIVAVQDAIQTTAIFTAQKIQDIRHNFVETAAIVMRAWANVIDFFDKWRTEVNAIIENVGTTIADNLFPSAGKLGPAPIVGRNLQETLELERRAKEGPFKLGNRPDLSRSTAAIKQIEQLRKDAQALDDLVKVERQDLWGKRMFEWFESVGNKATEAGRAVADFLKQRGSLADMGDEMDRAGKRKSYEIGMFQLDPVNRRLSSKAVLGFQRGETVETEQLGVLKQILGATNRVATEVQGLVMP